MPLTRLGRFTEASPGWLVEGVTVVVVVGAGSLLVVEDATEVVAVEDGSVVVGRDVVVTPIEVVVSADSPAPPPPPQAPATSARTTRPSHRRMGAR
jgi:cell division septation protein DedD|tara:strand:+ start:565 stop:852 length:288 start_codon:yes stop_codon:yes gene_type:complete